MAEFLPTPVMRRWSYLGLGLAFVAAMLLALNMGRYPISPAQVLVLLAPGIGHLFHAPEVPAQMQLIFFQVRLPRIVMACLVGAAQSGAGASYQGIFKNPMASPDILGATAGASFGAALALLNQQSHWVVVGSAFCFSLLAVALVLVIGRRARGGRILTLVLAGIMVGSLFSACTSFTKLVADPDNTLPAITYWLMGSLATATPAAVRFAALPIVLGLVPLILLRWRMNLLTLGDTEARAMGINTGRLRAIVIVAATLITATSVSVSGVIGWIGLVMPHLTRRITGSDLKHLLPASLVMGAIFLLLVDIVSRTLWTSEIPLGILTAFIGAPFFLTLILRVDREQ